MLTGEQLLAKCFHLICTPARCIDLVKGILGRRSTTGLSRAEGPDAERTLMERSNSRPLFVWEPVPDSCKPEEFSNMLEALKLVDFISPNHHELAAYFGGLNIGNPSEDAELATLKQLCNELLENGFDKGHGAVVVRRGEKGCYVASPFRHVLLPAYHQPRSDIPVQEKNPWKEKVIDPTGGGNTFLGAFCVGLLDTSIMDATCVENAALYGSVAASFAIEQVGMPKLSHGADGQELWNEAAVEDRLSDLRKRVLFPEITVVCKDR